MLPGRGPPGRGAPGRAGRGASPRRGAGLGAPPSAFLRPAGLGAPSDFLARGLGAGSLLRAPGLGAPGLGESALGAGLGAGVSGVCAAGAAALGAAGFFAGARLGRLGGGLCVRLLALGCRRELLAHLPHDGRLERGRGRLDEFTCFLQVTHQFFAGDSELFGELVDTQLCHISPFRKRLRSGDALLILLAAHRWVLIGCPSASNPLPLSRR